MLSSFVPTSTLHVGMIEGRPADFDAGYSGMPFES